MSIGLGLAGTLANTLTPASVLSMAEAQEKARQEQVAQLVQQASQSAAQAGQDYSQAAQQPAPQSGDTGSFIPSMMNDLASILSGNQQYAQRGQSIAKQRHEELVQSRMDNLKALHDTYLQRAQAAKDLQNHAMEEEARVSADKIAKTYQQLHDDQLQQNLNSRLTDTLKNRTENTDLSGLWAYLRAQVSSKNSLEITKDDAPAVFENTRTKTDFGDFIDKSKVPIKLQPLLLKYAADNKIQVTDAKQSGALQDLQSSWETLKSQAEQVMPILADGPADRIQSMVGKVARKAAGDEVLNSFDSQWANTVRALRAQAGAGGLRINQAEINKAQKWDRPDILWDTKPILQQKMKNWDVMRQNAMGAILSNDWRSDGPDGKVSVMSPDGETSRVPVFKAEQLVTKHHYARILDASAPATSASGGGTTRIKATSSTSAPVGAGPNQADRDYVKHLLGN